jgi:hypothetical protein
VEGGVEDSSELCVCSKTEHSLIRFLSTSEKYLSTVKLGFRFVMDNTPCQSIDFIFLMEKCTI